MERETLSHTQKQGIHPNILNQDSDFEEIHFKAITDGLGFHHGEKNKPISTFKKPVTTPLKKKAVPTKSEIATEQLVRGVENFYKAPEKKEEKLKIKKTKKIKKEKVLKARLPERAFAFVADLFIITAFMSLTFGILFLASGIEFDLISKLVTRDEIISYGGLLFSLNYLLYFTILDIKATPGKLLMGIKVANAKNRPISATIAFLRAMVTLFMLPAFFLMGLGIQDHIFSLKVLQNNEAK